MKMERMVVARRKLEGGKSPDAVARDLGFLSIATFTRQFQAFYQTTPALFQSGRKLFAHPDGAGPRQDSGLE
jgi:AraC-like DNA-binding protein